MFYDAGNNVDLSGMTQEELTDYFASHDNVFIIGEAASHAINTNKITTIET